MRFLVLVVACRAAVAAATVSAHHGGAIQAIAVTEDGSVAVSTDGVGVRLWPSLDGKREPVVVKMSAPVELAIGRDGDQLVIGGIDAVGALEIVRSSAAGELVSRRQVELGARCLAVHVTSAGLLVWRDDQTLALLDLGGQRIRTLAPDPGQRIDNVLVRNDGALVLVTVDGKVHGRWLELGARLAWGADTAGLAIDPRRAALSPDHRRVVAAARRKIGVVDLATGRATIVEAIADDNQNSPLGFIDDETFAFDRRQAARFWVRAGKLVPAATTGSMVVADHQLVGGSNVELVVQTPRGMRFLGYRIGKPHHSLVIRGGVVVAGAHDLVVTDELFHTRRRHAFDPAARDVLPLDPTHAVTFDGSTASLVELTNATKPADVTTTLQHADEVQYEPSTHLLAIKNHDDVELRHYESKRGELQPWGSVKLQSDEQLMLLDPSWAKGMIAVIVRPGVGSATLTWIREVNDGTVVRGDETTHAIPDDWAWTGRDLGAIGITRDIVRARGSLRAELREHRLSLHDGKTLRWVIPAWGVDDVAWSGDQLLVLGDGLATVALATGAFDRAQCGWEFGSWDTTTASEGGPVICED